MCRHALITLSISAGERNSGNLIKSNLSKKDLEFIKSIKIGIMSALKSGPESAYPVIDAVIIIESIEYESSRTSALAFEAAEIYVLLIY